MNTNLLFIVIVCSLLLGHISLSPLLMTMVLPTSIMASRDSERNDDEGDNNDKADPDGLNLLQICCTWSDKISDGVLEYSMSDEVDDDSEQIVRNAIHDWDLLIDNLVFIENNDADKAEVNIGFSNSDEDADGEEFHYGDSVAAGLTQLNFNNEGFIDSVDVTLSGGIFNYQIGDSELEQIVRHELGHVLGLGHANFDDSIMFENIDSRTRNISDCEIKGVIIANQWKLANSSSSKNNQNPEYPDIEYVTC